MALPALFHFLQKGFLLRLFAFFAITQQRFSLAKSYYDKFVTNCGNIRKTA